MTVRVLIAVLAVLLQLAVALSPMLPGLRHIWTNTAAADVVPTIIGIDFALLSAMLIAWHATEDARRKKHEDEVLGRVSELALPVPLSAHEFYPHFLAAMKSAKDRIFISYFAPYPPDKTADNERIAYYRQQAALTRARPQVQFRRLVRLTGENLPWIKKLIEELKGQKNADLGCLKDLPANDKMPLALSTQLVDSDRVWFVALEVHEHADRHRDLYIHNTRIAEAFAKYYLRLWNVSTQLVVSGNLTPEGEALLMQAPP